MHLLSLVVSLAIAGSTGTATALPSQIETRAQKDNPVCPVPVEKYCWHEGMAKAPVDSMLWFISCENNLWTCLYTFPGNFTPTAILPGGNFPCTSAQPGGEAVRCAHTGVGWKTD